MPKIIPFMLWCLFFGLAAMAAVPVLSPEVQIVDAAASLAREKDIVWMALAVGLAAIMANVWLVKQLLRQGTEQVVAIKALRDEIKGRPCLYGPSPPPNLRS